MNVVKALMPPVMTSLTLYCIRDIFFIVIHKLCKFLIATRLNKRSGTML